MFITDILYPVAKEVLTEEKVFPKCKEIDVPLLVGTGCVSVTITVIIMIISFITSDVLEHKWRASLKTILFLYE